MKTTLKFTIESLLFGIENPKGNIEQVLFAKKMADKEGIPNCNRLAKLSFEEDTVNKALPGTVPFDETLILGYEGWSVMYEDYRNAILLNKLTEEEIKEVFDFILKNMDLVQPKPDYMLRED